MGPGAGGCIIYLAGDTVAGRITVHRQACPRHLPCQCAGVVSGPCFGWVLRAPCGAPGFLSFLRKCVDMRCCPGWKSLKGFKTLW